ncbi:protein SENESCENCE-ASSOCIATED GENE 21, mitochondrial-like [Sesamum indicum]|uniref:Protein SENESCENCE-ASSOCIATED GENE 21, mitochondrial-like n=1 Tax=Sesamum indicum TaxID=4182 RepID=A0A6I9T6E4_SESIN|nr:protein SENESCENCE-ASSOCIATED GENE 21, mitochondrial-like [Sesamum indicum]
MARSFSNLKTLSAFIARRGYAAASPSVGSSSVRSGAPNVMLKTASEDPSKTAWVPDPVTGYYRPENQVKELDPVEMREMLIKNKTCRGQ